MGASIMPAREGVGSAGVRPPSLCARALGLLGKVFGCPAVLEQRHPPFRLDQRGDVGCIVMHRGSVAVHQDAPYAVSVAPLVIVGVALVLRRTARSAGLLRMSALGRAAVVELFPRLRGKWIDAKRRDVGGRLHAPPLGLAPIPLRVLPPLCGGRAQSPAAEGVLGWLLSPLHRDQIAVEEHACRTG